MNRSCPMPRIKTRVLTSAADASADSPLLKREIRARVRGGEMG